MQLCQLLPVYGESAKQPAGFLTSLLLLLISNMNANHHAIQLLQKNTKNFSNDLTDHAETLLQRLNHFEEREKKHKELVTQAQPLISKLAMESKFDKIALVVSAISHKKTHDLRCLLEEREQKRYEIGNKAISF